MTYCNQWQYDNACPDDDYYEDDDDVINDVLPRIKPIILQDMAMGYDAAMIINDLSWLWEERITPSSVNRWKRAIHAQFQPQKSRLDLLAAA